METRTKECGKCGEEKAMEEFHVNNAAKDGRASGCKVCVCKEHKKKYYDPNHPSRERIRAHYQKNKDRIIKYMIEYNREYKKEYRQRPHVKVYRTQGKRMRTLIQNAGKKKALTTVEYLGCTVKELMERLEKQWKPGMSWDNYEFTGWHIDHIRPCNSFDLTDVEQQKICFHYTNLQPLWAKDNMRKSNKWEEGR